MRRLLFLISAVLFVTVLGIYMGMEKDTAPVVRFSGTSYLEGVRIAHMTGGALKWDLHADKAVFLNKEDVKLEGIKIRFPEKQLTLSSDEGLYKVESRDLTIQGNIKASTGDYDIVAEQLSWDSSRNELVSDKKVTIKAQTFVVEGDTLKANAEGAELKNNVRAVFDDVRRGQNAR